jgi:hypothetical protein
MEMTGKKLRLTAEHAEKLLLKNTYGCQRKLKPKRVATLSRKIAKGMFRTANISLVVSRTGVETLMNGQHQLHAIVHAGQTVDAYIETFTLTNGEGPEEIADLYAQFDDGGLRSIADIAKTFADVHGMGDWPVRAITNIVAALTWLEFKGKSRDVNKEDRARLIGKYSDEAHFAHCMAWSDGAEKWFIRSAVIAAMISTWRKNKKDAEEFWTQVRDGELLKKTDPAYRLRAFLIAATSSRQSSDATSSLSSPRAGWGEVYAKSVHAWNAQREGREVKFLRSYKGTPMPVAK